MNKFIVRKIKCDPDTVLSPYKCRLCKMDFTQLYWYYIVGCGFFHSEKCAEMFILREM